MPSDREIEAVAEALMHYGGCSGGCSNRPCEVDYKDAEAILSAAATARPDVTTDDVERGAAHIRALHDPASPGSEYKAARTVLESFERASLGEGSGDEHGQWENV